MNIYEKIDFLLEIEKTNQKKMCESINIPTSTYSSMKSRNSKSISIETVREIGKFFNVSIDYFLDNDIEKTEYKKFKIQPQDEYDKEFLEKYNSLDKEFKKIIMHNINAFLEIQEKNNNEPKKVKTTTRKIIVEAADGIIYDTPKEYIQEIKKAK